MFNKEQEYLLEVFLTNKSVVKKITNRIVTEAPADAAAAQAILDIIKPSKKDEKQIEEYLIVALANEKYGKEISNQLKLTVKCLEYQAANDTVNLEICQSQMAPLSKECEEYLIVAMTNKAIAQNFTSKANTSINLISGGEQGGQVGDWLFGSFFAEESIHGTFTKTSTSLFREVTGSTDPYANNHVYDLQFEGDQFAEFTFTTSVPVGQTNSFIGFQKNPPVTDATVGNSDMIGLYFKFDGVIQYQPLGSNGGYAGTTWANGDTFRVEYVGNKLLAYKNGSLTPFFTSPDLGAALTGGPVSIAATLSEGNGLENLSVGSL